MKRLFLLIITIAFLGAQGKAQSAATPLSLQDCYNYAMHHNYAIKNADLNVLIQKAQIDETLAQAYPHVNGSYGFTDYLKAPATFVPNSFFGKMPSNGFTAVTFTPQYSSAPAINASQVLYDPNVAIAMQAKKTILESAERATELSYEAVKYYIYRSYNSLVIAYRQFDILKTSLAYARSIEHDVQVTQATGFAEKIDVERSNVQVNNLSIDSMRVQNQLTLAEQMLKFQIGMDVNTPIILSDTALETRKQEAQSLLLTEESYDKVPMFNLMQTIGKLNEFNVKRYKLNAYPSVMATGGIGYNFSTIDFGDMFKPEKYLFYSLVGFQVNVPIYNGHVRINQLREANLNVEKTNNSIDSLKQAIDFQVTSSRTSLRNAILQLRSQRNNIDVAEDVLELARKKYKAGVGSNLEVTQAQTDLLMAQNNYFGTLLDLVNAEADLKKALGLLK